MMLHEDSAWLFPRSARTALIGPLLTQNRNTEAGGDSSGSKLWKIIHPSIDFHLSEDRCAEVTISGV
ncbi:hypothetical protein AMECASPLE_024127 [Ameca splendens]|uniref:Uncharacterized protein n=1 Tax=Ameca splendens TaxID=208324 RepID=A0ABV1ACS0_9TELE